MLRVPYFLSVELELNARNLLIVLGGSDMMLQQALCVLSCVCARASVSACVLLCVCVSQSEASQRRKEWIADGFSGAHRYHSSTEPS